MKFKKSKIKTYCIVLFNIHNKLFIMSHKCFSIAESFFCFKTLSNSLVKTSSVSLNVRKEILKELEAFTMNVNNNIELENDDVRSENDAVKLMKDDNDNDDDADGIDVHFHI